MTFITKDFVKMLRETDTVGSMLFNPYRDVCPYYDTPKAPDVRSLNLYYLLQKINNFDSILVGEAPGHLGCRKTGIAFTDNIMLPIAQYTYDAEKFQIATKNTYYKEASATFMWSVLTQLENPPLMWNIIPFHPHNINNQISNRTPNKNDYKISEKVINYFFNNTRFKKYYAIGRQSEKKLRKMGLNPIYIRHPSHGGSVKFREGMAKNFEAKEL